jgi:hypothetical protein
MRTVGRTDDFVVTLKCPLTLTNQRNRFQVLVHESVIPHTIKQINSSNNSLNYRINKGANNYYGSITLTAGNYNIITLLQELNIQLKADIFSTMEFLGLKTGSRVGRSNSPEMSYILLMPAERNEFRRERLPSVAAVGIDCIVLTVACTPLPPSCSSKIGSNRMPPSSPTSRNAI